MKRFQLLRCLGLIAAVIAVVLVLAACGGGDDDDQPASPTVPSLPTTTPPGGVSVAQASITPFPDISLGPTPTRFPGFPTLAVAPTIPPSYPESIQIVSPVTASLLQGNVTIFGSASHPQFIQYALEYGPDPNSNNLWYPITPQAVTTPVINNALGAWNTTLVPDGSYQIRLHLYLNGGIELTNVAVTGLQVRNQQAVSQAVVTNTAPVINPIASLNLPAGTSTTIALGIFDANSDPTTFTAISDNLAVASVTSGGQAITVTALSPGIATIRIEVSDNRGGRVQTSFLVNVPATTTTNRPPNISPIPSQVLAQGSVVVAPVTITDPDGDATDFTVTSAAPTVVQASKGADGRSINLAGFSPGTTTVTIAARDAGGRTSTSAFSVVVNPATQTNNAPSIAAIPSQTLEVGEVLELILSISDPDNDATTFSFTNSTPGVLNIETLQNNTIRLTAITAGQTTLAITVRDEHGSTTSTQFNVVVTAPPAPNQNPVISPIPNQTVRAGEIAEVRLNMSDPDGGTITFSTTSENPDVVATGPASSNSVWVLGVSEGTATVTIGVGDGQGGSVTTSFSVTVNPATVPNQVPTVDDVAAQTVEVGQTVTVPINYSDPDGDTLTLTVQSSAPEIAIVFQNNPLELTISGAAPGSAAVTLTVNDGRGGTDSTTFNVTVTAANQPPSVAPIPSQSCFVGDATELQVIYSDLEGNAITLTAQSDHPEIAAVEMVNEDTLRLTCVTAGDASVTIQADDGRGGVNTVAFLVTVSAPNQPPTIEAVSSVNLNVGESATIALNYDDPDGDPVSLSPIVDDESIVTIVVTTPNELQLTGVAAGSTTVTLNISDGRGGTASTAFGVDVEALNQQPVISAISSVSLTAGESTAVALTYSDPDGDELSVSATSDNEGVATVVVNSPTELAVTAVGEGTATITVTVDDGRGGATSTAFAVAVDVPNQEPTIDPISPLSLTAGESETVVITANDPDGDQLAVSAASDNDAVATVVVNSPTELSVTAVSAGSATITVTVDDGRGGTASAAFTVEVMAANQQPIIDPIAPLSLTAGESETVTVAVGDPDGDELTVSAASDNEAVATVVVNSPTELGVTAAGEGIATITVTVEDGRGGTASAAFTVEVGAQNQQPTIDPIAPLSLTAGESETVTITASDPDGDELTISAASDNEAVATVVVNSATELSVTAVSAGTATITATVDDGRGGTANAAFTVEVAAANQQPTIDPIAPLSLTAGESETVSITASDPDGDELTVSAASDDEAVVIVAVNSPTELSVTAVSAGIATITVTVDDGRGGATSTAFTVTVDIPNQQPTIEPIAPIALTTGESTAVSITTNDPDGDELTVSATSDNETIATVTVNSPTELSVTAVSAGSATITVNVDDGRGGTASTAFTVDVGAQNQQPTIEPIAPVALTVGESTAVSITTNDPDGDELTVSANSDNETVATVTVNSPTELSVTAVSAGSATIIVNVDDGRGGNASAAFTVDVGAQNQQPTIEPIAPVTLTAGESTVVSITTNDPDGDELTVSANSDNETVATVTVNSPTELSVIAVSAGSATITVNVDDGRGGATSTAFTVEVGAQNQQPTIEPIAPVALTAGESTVVSITTNDPDGDLLTVSASSSDESIATVAVNGTNELSVTGVSAGTASITVTVDDGRGGNANAAFTVEVGAQNQQPTIDPIAPLTLTAGESEVVAINASDPDGDELTLSATSDTESVATVTVNSPTELSVTAVGTGTATITVTVDDKRGGTATAAFTVDVGAPNQQPTIDPLAPLTLTAGESVSVTLTISDPDGDLLTVSATSDNDTVATVAVNAPTELTVTAISAGTATITVSVDDGRGGTASAAFTVGVNAANQQPSIDPIAPINLTVGDSSVVALTYSDPDGDVLSVSANSDNEAIATVVASAPFELLVNAVGAGTATITVALDDGRGGTTSTAFTVDVAAPNQLPNINPIAPVTLTAGESTSVTITYSDPDGDSVSVTPVVDDPTVATVNMNSLFDLLVIGVVPGTTTVTVNVDDGRGGTGSTAFTVEVVAANQQPTLDPIAPITLNAGESLAVTLSYSDPDGDTINVSPVSDNPAVASVALNSASELAVTAVSQGTATITVNIDDGRGGATSTAFTVEVAALNQQPTIDPIAPVSLNVGDATTVALTYSDPDGDTINVTPSVDNPAVASVTPNGPSELLVIANSAGTATVTVSIDDGRGGTASAAFTIEVAALNQQPTIDPIAPVSLNVGDATTVALTYSDPDGDTVNVTPLVDNPAVASVTLNGASELLVIANSAGTATVTVSIDDGRGGATSTAFTINVTALNQQPTIDPIALISLNVGDATTVALTYSDPDGDLINVTPSVDNPAVASVTPNGPSELLVTANSAGTATVTVSIDDGRGGATSTAFTVNVTALNQQPSIDPIAPVTMSAGETVTLTLNYSDPDGDIVTVFPAIDNPGVATVALNSPTELLLIANGAGTATVTISIDDGRGETASTSFTVDIAAVNQQPTIDPLVPISLNLGEGTSVMLSYNDPDGDSINVTPSVDNPSIASVTLNGPFELLVTANGLGTAAVTVSIDDGRGGTASTAFTVEVLAGQQLPVFDVTTVPQLPDFDALYPDLQSVYSDGINNYARNPNAFSIAGDDILNSTMLMEPIAAGQYNIGNSPELQGAIDHFNFAFDSVAYDNGWTVEDMLNPALADPTVCQPGETPLDCELRVTAPVVIFIGFTPSSATVTPVEVFQTRLEEAVDKALDTGTIPILLTLPDDGTVDAATLAQYNQAIYNVATQHSAHPDFDVPLWNLYITIEQATQGFNIVGGSGPADYSDAALTAGVNRRGVFVVYLLEQFRQTFIAP